MRQARADRRIAVSMFLVSMCVVCACGGDDDDGGDWFKTGHYSTSRDGISCNVNLVGARRTDPQGDRWICEHAPSGGYYWFEYSFEPTLMAMSGIANLEPRIAAGPGSSALVLDSDGVSSWAFALTDDSAPPTLTITSGPDGTLTVNPAEFVMPQTSTCVITGEGVQECLGLTVGGAGPIAAMTVDSQAGSVNVPMQLLVDVDAISGYAGLPDSCRLGPIAGSLVASDYDPATGSATLTMLGRPLAAADQCGDYDDLFNEVLGLPGTVDVVIQSTISLP